MRERPVMQKRTLLAVVVHLSIYFGGVLETRDLQWPAGPVLSIASSIRGAPQRM